MGNRHDFDLRALPRDAARRVRATRRRLNLAVLAALALRAVAALTFGAGAAVHAATQLKAVGYYLHLLAVPVAQSVDPPF